jgi:cell wall-associated NlpC family hydrolase
VVIILKILLIFVMAVFLSICKVHAETLPAHERMENIPDDFQETDIPAAKMMDSTYINKIITAGYKYIGNSVYVFGGGRSPEDIAKGRFDCSSFVQWAFRQAGIEIGSTTDTIKNDGRQVSISELKPGDLVFFDTYKKDGHVGIYIGNQRFIGSQSSTGVAIADMSSGYWKNKFNGRVVRIID